MYLNVKKVSAGLAALSMLAVAACKEEADNKNHIGSNTPIQIAPDAAAALTEACTFYSNLLYYVDGKHFEGPAITPSEDMAYAGLQKMLAATYVESYYDEITEKYDESVITYTDDSKEYIASLQLGQKVIEATKPEAQSFSSYTDHCVYFQNAAVTINAEIGTDIFSLYETAVNGALDVSRDTHTSYLPPAQRENMRNNTNGSFGGLGIEVSKSPNGILINAPIEGTPADKAGLSAGDVIVSVEGKPTKAMSINDAVDIMRGDVGTNITISIQRDENEQPFDVTLTRDVIRITAAKVRTLDVAPDTIHVDVSTFSRQTIGNIKEGIVKEVDKALDADKPIRNLVLDFRNNPGGLLTQAVYVSDYFIDAAAPHNTQRLVGIGRTANDRVYYEDRSYKDIPELQGLRIVVLTDRGSASASEIVAGAMQDAGFEIIGHRSFGKGTVQTIIDVTTSGRPPSRLNRVPHGTIKITTSAFFPGRTGKSNQATGITPNVNVIYNDVRDETQANGRREENLSNVLTIPGQARDGHKSEYICSLRAEFAGVLSDEEIASVPDDLKITMRILNEETGEREEAEMLDADLHCALMRLQGLDSTEYAEITPVTPAPQP